MLDLDTLLQPDRGQPAVALHLVRASTLQDWLSTQPEGVRTLVAAQRFSAASDSVVILPDTRGTWFAAAGVPDGPLGPWGLARAVETLPPATYRLVAEQPGAAALGWLLAHYRFDRYKTDEQPPRILLTTDAAQIEPLRAEARAVALVRDLVNTPALELGPDALEHAATDLANRTGAALSLTAGDALAQGFPMIHAVGQAAMRAHAPRLIELEWGDPAHPRVAIVGKGVCFDSGGLDIKPPSGMRNMKKDMGGAAHALALAGLIIDAGLPVRLHLLIPAVENAIAGNALRPGDVLRSRGGPTVEIGNTDAEGRLILADALTRSGEEQPVLIVDFATLTGAARVALGPDLPATFCNDETLVNEALAAGLAVDDPLWRMPLHPDYEAMLRSDVADLTNAPEGGFAGAITAALFLQRFVPAGTPWLHLDTFAWMPSAKPGRPRGGEALGLRAVWAMLRARF